MGERVREAGAAARGAEGAGVGGIERGRRPLALVFQEDLDRAAAEVASAARRQGHPARDGDVGAQLVRGGGHPPSLHLAPGHPAAA